MAISKIIYKTSAEDTGTVWMDTTDKTVTAGSMLNGITALKNDGTTATGNIASKSSSDLTASGATVTAPAGYYASAASKSVSSGSAGTPTATKGTVSNHQISVTPSVTNTTGYITGGTINGTAVTVNVTELESGTKSITQNGTGISVSGYSAVDVAVPSSGTDCPTFTITINSSWTAVTSVTCDKTYSECVDYLEDGNGFAIFVIDDGSSTQTAGANLADTPSGRLVYGAGASEVAWLVVDFYSNGTITGTLDPITWRDSTDLTASTLTVTAPAGYYESNATKTLTDQNLIAGNIKKDVQIFGVTGTYEGGGGGTSWETVYNGTQYISADWGNGNYYTMINPWGETIDLNSVWRITWDATPYECTATWAGSPDGDPYAIGNYTYDGGTGGTNYPFFMQPYFTNTELAVVTAVSGSHTIKIEKQVSGGGSTGLEYETGTYTPVSDVASATVSFANTHSTLPAIVVMAEASDSLSSWTNYSLFVWNYINTGDLFGGGFPRSDSYLNYGRVDIIRKSNTSALGVTNTSSLQYPSSETSATNTTYPRYWVTVSSFKAYSNNDSYYWRSGRTYKWIAVWAPST